MSSDISEVALGRIHRNANQWKAVGYWIGFLKGVVASEAIETQEKKALVSHSQELFEGFQDGDAFDVLEDLKNLDEAEMQRQQERVMRSYAHTMLGPEESALLDAFLRGGGSARIRSCQPALR